MAFQCTHDYMVASDLQDGRLVVVLPDHKPTGLDIFVVYPSRRHLPGRVRLFLGFLLQTFHDTAEWQG